MECEVRQVIHGLELKIVDSLWSLYTTSLGCCIIMKFISLMRLHIRAQKVTLSWIRMYIHLSGNTWSFRAEVYAPYYLPYLPLVTLEAISVRKQAWGLIPLYSSISSVVLLTLYVCRIVAEEQRFLGLSLQLLTWHLGQFRLVHCMLVFCSMFDASCEYWQY